MQSLFKVVKLANFNFESISDDGGSQDAEHYIKDLNNLCEIGGNAFSVLREASNFSLYKLAGDKTVESAEAAEENRAFEVLETDELKTGD
ncbi:MAG TPA: hypothetical protein VIL74_03780 [Pyrinomonadaceae bacterium]|jgi:hypothetical protein